MSTPSQEKLLDALSENSLIKAVLIVDHNGRIKGKRGQAKVLERGPQEATVVEDQERPTENVYLIELSQDLLAVVFEESIEFEKLRRTVDTLVRHAGLELDEGSGQSSASKT